jgi:hypothetical protein
MDKVQKHDSFKRNTPSSEPFRNDLVHTLFSFTQKIGFMFNYIIPPE